MPYSPPPVPLSDQVPVSEATAPLSGVVGAAARTDHRHPRLSSATRVVLGADGTATATYTRQFTAKPVITLTAINPSGRQVTLEVISDIQSGGIYTGCVIKGSRAQTLPALGNMNIIGQLASALGNFDTLGGSASGVEVSVLALQQS